MAINYYCHSIMKLNNFAVVIISVLFLHSSFGDDDYHHQWTQTEIITEFIPLHQNGNHTNTHPFMKLMYLSTLEEHRVEQSVNILV